MRRLPLQKRHFDVVVVDEASQITVPASLGALYRAGKFVLVRIMDMISPSSSQGSPHPRGSPMDGWILRRRWTRWASYEIDVALSPALLPLQCPYDECLEAVLCCAVICSGGGPLPAPAPRRGLGCIRRVRGP